MASSKIVVESRVHLFSTLAEAAELEHNFMCLYLYAMFGLKRNLDEGLTEEELAAVERWRRVILGICIEEMTHLALVANLFVAIGSTPHFSRPNFPAFPGMYPEGIIVELAKFDMDTLDHFIYLERPRSLEIQDGKTFSADIHYSRVAPVGRLMAYAGDYETVGDFYQALRESIDHLCEKIGEKALFCGDPAQQIGPVDSPLPGLIIIKDKETALKALDTIVRQGESALQEEGSHFARFQGIKKEYEELLKKNPSFDPSRPIARNPVMRTPLDREHRVFVDEPLAAQFMDLSNALYMFMLKSLVQIYTIENRPKAEKKELLEIAFTIMHAMGIVGETLTYMPASPSKPGVNAGMSFAMNRFTASLSSKGELLIMIERLQQFEAVFEKLFNELNEREKHNQDIRACLDQLKVARDQVHDVLIRARKLAEHSTATEEVSSSTASSLAEVAKSSDAAPIERSESSAIAVSFETKKCIHARHCVTQLPGVFMANTPGKWIFPEKAYPEELAAVIRQCPSGALLYKSKTASLHDEEAPAVNVLRLRENGPYTLLADLQVDGEKAGYRATLCRCGKSNNKPFCDNAHVAAKFKASGEPETIDATELKNRGGTLSIQRTENGPLSLSGNLELCTGTGRVVLRTESVYLCRCGNSKSKPICDNSHIAAGFKDSTKKTPPELTL
ncbi:ferritin-like domain-containing protein [Bdellovibrio sp. HCB337]|uniref:ferritin-like domain-containing protein n=1 Tax=Bdellovibrio sp. HCB337 TaxID=3394358 RepID=UPI0039A4D12A